MFEQLPYWPRTYIQVGSTGFAIAALAMPIAILVLRRLGVVDATAPHKIHAKPVVRGGGIVIFFAFALAALLPGYRSHPFNGVLIGAFLCTLVGFADDVTRGVPAVVKLGTLFAVTLILSYFEVRLNLFKWAPLDLALGMLWIVGVTSAFNGTDNMDGLAGGIALIVSTMFLIIAGEDYAAAGTETSLSWFGMMAAALIGANLGFLLYNFKPAKIFMGDSGSFFLGFTLAALGVMGEWSPNRIVSCTIPILILGVPLFDFAYILLSRIVRGETRNLRAVIEHCAPDHLSHRLTWIGFSERQAVLFIYLVALALGTSGILLRNSTSLVDSALGLLQGLAIVLIIMVLMSRTDRRSEARPAPAPGDESLPPEIAPIPLHEALPKAVGKE